MADMIYNGKQLSWSPKGEKVTDTFKATSGLLDASGDYRFARHQCRAENGPLPEGTYVFSLAIDSQPAQDDGTKSCALRPSWKVQTDK